MNVRYAGVGKVFAGVEALASLDLEVPDGSFLALLGPSGCGKTTALRILAGLEEPTSGHVFIGERDVTQLQPKDRDVAMVFQSYALYPHKSVFDNIAYPLRIRKTHVTERDRRVREVAELLSITALLDRMPRALSGGQRQRVALARAIVREPRAFLMDEPLSNLDAQLRLQMRIEIKRLQRALGVTTLYVTHDQVEAMTMADLVAVMCEGHLQQLAQPGELYSRPANLFVACFCGSPPMNVVYGEVADGSFRHPAGTVTLPAGAAPGPAKLGFRPEHAAMTPAGTDHALSAEVYVVEPLGNETLIALKVGDDLINLRAAAGVDPPIGSACAVRPEPAHLHLFDAKTGVAVRNGQPSEGAKHDRPPEE
ncbi:MAG TPA: ABC transporter ATP-binding protein [Gaiellales bacterium]|jgi:multiple sugar transport system ATP-binding protein